MHLRRLRLTLLLALAGVAAPGSWLTAQTPSPASQDGAHKAAKLDAVDSGRMHAILREAYSSIKSDYYDPKYRGIDLDARFREYDARLKTAPTVGEAFHIIAAFLSGFHDSHLFFMPPGRAVSFDSGYRMQMVGDKCFVTQVRPGSDAAQKLHPGDEILQFNGFNLGRSDLFEVEYFFHTLSPGATERLHLRSPDGAVFDVTVHNTIRQLKRSLDAANENDMGDLMLRAEEDEDLSKERLVTMDKTVFWKMAEFNGDESSLNGVFGTLQNASSLVLDLRGNPGGYTVTLQWALGHLFDHEVKISDRVGRRPAKPQIAKASRAPYKGKVIVLVDSKSASSSEVFARVVQLEHRGTVLGDTSAGAVMEARQFTNALGSESVVLYGLSITDANLLMADGKSLEGVGVQPDEVVVPTAGDLLKGLDPVLARAAELAGTNLDSTSAAKLFPFQWRKL